MGPHYNHAPPRDRASVEPRPPTRGHGQLGTDVMRIWPVFLDFVPSLSRAFGRVAIPDPDWPGLAGLAFSLMVETVTSNRPVFWRPNVGGQPYRSDDDAASPTTVLSDGDHLIDSCPPLETLTSCCSSTLGVSRRTRRGSAAFVDEFSSRAPDHPSSGCLRDQHLRHEGTRERRRGRPGAQHSIAIMRRQPGPSWPASPPASCRSRAVCCIWTQVPPSSRSHFGNISPRMACRVATSP